MRLMIDANILLDVLQARKPYVEKSAIIWKLCETGQDTGYVSALSFANLVYIMRKELDPEKIEEIYSKLEMIFQFVALNTSDLTNAIKMKWSDFEDALQSETAKRKKADYIITRNVKDFCESKVKAITPEEYCALIQRFS